MYLNILKKLAIAAVLTSPLAMACPNPDSSGCLRSPQAPAVDSGVYTAKARLVNQVSDDELVINYVNVCGFTAKETLAFSGLIKLSVQADMDGCANVAVTIGKNEAANYQTIQIDKRGKTVVLLFKPEIQ